MLRVRRTRRKYLSLVFEHDIKKRLTRGFFPLFAIFIAVVEQFYAKLI